MQLIDPPDLPEQNIVDPLTGYSASVPATQQGYPYWWKNEPEAWQRILAIRQRHGIVVDDLVEQWEALREAEPG